MQSKEKYHIYFKLEQKYKILIKLRVKLKFFWDLQNEFF